MNELQKNADRFNGFADLYDAARPACPGQVPQLLIRLIGRSPAAVADFGCGTGLSTVIWAGVAHEVVGVEPGDEMGALARQKAERYPNLRIIKAFSDQTGLADESVDIVTCSQSFHWMNPQTTLREAARILRPGGVFAAYDCDWPPLCGWRVGAAYDELFETVRAAEETLPDVKDTFRRWNKDGHLENIRQSGHFRQVREIVFSNTERCGADRMIGLARSQGSLQKIEATHPGLLSRETARFEEIVRQEMGAGETEIVFCYRMRVGVK